MGYGAMQGIPMVASSPIRHDSPLNLHGLEVTQYQPPWVVLTCTQLRWKILFTLYFKYRRLWVISPFTPILTVAMALWTKHLHFNISLIRQVIVISILTVRQASISSSPFHIPGTSLSRYRLLFIFVKCRFFPSPFPFLFVYYLFHVFSARGFFCLNSFWYLFFKYFSVNSLRVSSLCWIC